MIKPYSGSETLSLRYRLTTYLSPKQYFLTHRNAFNWFSANYEVKGTNLKIIKNEMLSILPTLKPEIKKDSCHVCCNYLTALSTLFPRSPHRNRNYSLHSAFSVAQFLGVQSTTKSHLPIVSTTGAGAGADLFQGPDDLSTTPLVSSQLSLGSSLFSLSSSSFSL